jgi:hypothetical protein
VWLIWPTSPDTNVDAPELPVTPVSSAPNRLVKLWDPSEAVGVIEEQVNCAWVQPPPIRGERFISGDFLLNTGVAQLRLDSGTRVTLRGPCNAVVSAAGQAVWMDGGFSDDDRYPCESVVLTAGTVIFSFQSERSDDAVGHGSNHPDDSPDSLVKTTQYQRALQQRGPSFNLELPPNADVFVDSKNARFAVSRNRSSMAVHVLEGRVKFEPKAASGADEYGNPTTIESGKAKRFTELKNVTNPMYGWDRFSSRVIEFEPELFAPREGGLGHALHD